MTALSVAAGSVVAGCPSDATQCAYLIVNVGTSAGQPPEDGTPVTLQAVGGQRLYISMIGGTFTYGSQQNQTTQCVPVPVAGEPIAFTVTPVPSGEATLRVDLLGQSAACAGDSGAGGGATVGDGGSAGDAGAIDVGCAGDLLANKIVVFVAPVATTASSGGTGGAGTGGAASTTSSATTSGGTGGSDGG